MNIIKRVSKKGEVSYLIRVGVGYINNRQVVKSMTYKPQKGMKPKAIEKELNRQAVLFEERAKKEFELWREETDDDSSFERISITFSQLADEWLDLQESTGNLKTSSLLRMKNCKERTYAALGDVPVTKVSYRKIQTFITSLSKQGVNKMTGGGLSAKTQKHYLTFISDVMIYAKKSGLINDNPCRDITISREKKTEKNIYSLEETKTILSAVEENADTDYILFFYLLAYCGMRRGEVMGLEYGDIDFDSHTLTIKRTSNYRSGYGIYTDSPKTESSCRTLYIQPKIIELIERLRYEQQIQAEKCGSKWHKTDRLFVTWCGEPMSPNTPYTWLRRFCEREGLPFKGLHSFRHFVATQALANGIDVKSVSSMLGHSQTSTTLNIYAHAIQKTNEKVLNSVAALLD